MLCNVLSGGIPIQRGTDAAGSSEHVSHGLRAPLLLDVGCGLTDLRTFLVARGVTVRYVGIDITWSILAEARRRHRDCVMCQTDVFAESPFRDKTFDAVFCSGAFNLRLGNNDAFAVRALARMGELARTYVVANFLHLRTPQKYQHCYYFDPAALCASIRGRCTQLTLVDDYLENDFTLVIRP